MSHWTDYDLVHLVISLKIALVYFCVIDAWLKVAVKWFREEICYELSCQKDVNFDGCFVVLAGVCDMTVTHVLRLN